MKHPLAIVGLLLILLAALTFIFAREHYSDSAFYLMTAPLPTAVGAHYEQEVRIAASETYGVYVACSAVGPLDGQDDINPSRQYDMIPCDMTVTISEGDQVIFEQRARFLRRYATSWGKVYYDLLNLDISKTGRYDFKINNYTDLSFLNSTEPKLELSMGGGAIESGLALRALFFWGSAGMAVVALLFIIGDFIHSVRKKRLESQI